MWTKNVQSNKNKRTICCNWKTNDFAAYKKEWKELDQLQLAKYKDVTKDQLNSKFSFYEIMYTFTSGTVFMGFFLGIAFLAMMASCLMFKILSGATKDTKRYQMLRKIEFVVSY